MKVTFFNYVDYEMDITDIHTYKLLCNYAENGITIKKIIIKNSSKLVRRFARDFKYDRAELILHEFDDNIKYFIDHAEQTAQRFYITLCNFDATCYIFRPGWYRRIYRFDISEKHDNYYIPGITFGRAYGYMNGTKLYTYDTGPLRVCADRLHMHDAFIMRFSQNPFGIWFDHELMFGYDKLTKVAALPFKVWLLKHRSLPKFIIIKILLYTGNLILHEGKLLFKY